MITEDPKVKALEKKKKDIMQEIEDKMDPPPLTPEEEKDKFNNEIVALEKKAVKIDNVKKVDKLETKIENKKKAGLDTAKDEAKLEEAK